jgi:IclR family mhp operon transcriptional activator
MLLLVFATAKTIRTINAGYIERMVPRAEHAAMRGVSRTLGVIRALNEKNGATVLELSHALGISRPALYRILEGLISEGYVTRHVASDTYRLTIKVRGLSDGFRDEDWVTEIASPVLHELQHTIVWPTDFFTYADDSMVLRDTSRRGSPMVIDRVATGDRLPVLLSAVGIAYLAACSDIARETILARLARSPKPEDSLAQDRNFVELVIAKTRKRKYATRPLPFMPWTGSIAVPVMARKRPLGAIAFTYIASALTAEAAAAQHGQALRAAARRIELALRRTNIEVLDPAYSA